jgi:outer membrane receptor protein involved in Fe transport
MEMRSSGKTRLGIALVLALSAPAYAQRVTGGITGTVKDATGAILPGVTVTLSGERVMGTEVSVTNENGLYRFVQLAPGSYNLAFVLAGFATLNRTGLIVSVGGTLEENISLQLSSVSESVTVTGASPVVDTISSDVGTNYDNDWVRNAPTARQSFYNLVASAPGVNAGSRSISNAIVYGSARDDNSYQLDGTDITDAFFGQALAEPNTDAIEEIEILSLGAPAEYGNIQGAVFNIVTKQGSNAFHGDANFYYQSDGLTGRNTTEQFDDGFPFRRDSYRDFTAQVGGPIAKDKVWFFGSYQHQLDGSSPTGVDPSFGTTVDNFDRYLAKINVQFSPAHRIVGTFHDDIGRNEYTPGPNDAPSTYVARKNKTPTPGVTYTGLFGTNTVLDVRYSGFYGNVDLGPANEGVPRTATRFYDLDTGQITGGHYYWYLLDVTKTTVNAKLSHFTDDFLGASHDFKFGVQFGHATAGGVYGYNNLVFAYTVNGMRYGYGYERFPFSYGGNTRSLGLFADDTVQANDHLTLNLGVRFDTSHAYSPAQPELDQNAAPTGKTFPKADYFTWNTVSPRLGFNLKLTSDGKTVLKGHWGRYHRTITTGDFANIIGPSIPSIFLGTYNFDTNEFENKERLTDNSNLRIDPSLKSPYTDQFILSVDRELTTDLGLSLVYVNKRGRDFSAWQDLGGVYAEIPYVDDRGADASGQTITVFQLQNSVSDRTFLMTSPQGMKTNVNAFTAQITKRMSSRWQLTSSLTYQKSEGRLSLSATDSIAQRSGLQFNPFGQNPNDFVNTYGRLNADRPITFKTQLVYQLPAEFLVGLNFQYSDGAPQIRRVPINDVTGIPTRLMTVTRGDRGRFPSQTLVDLRVQKDFSVGKGARIGFFFDGLNLLNDNANEAVRSSLATSSSFDIPDVFILPRRFMLGAKFQF